ncbi:39S ribosomal protein L15, mitochondrial [Lamellibrachia satsuma]|nr:39S ribosomal protein L15, mitochondrial [Lamellibrachia satsuma]
MEFTYDGSIPPLSLLQLQRLIDLNMLDTNEPIDLTALCNTKVFRVDTSKRQYGVNLTDEGADIFDARVHLEVQWTNEQTIAAVEKNGGTITTRFYDPDCVNAMQNPPAFFRKGRPIPRCKLPPIDALPYYSDADNRGYLADPEKIREARIVLAQKFGYALPDISEDPHFEMLMRRKDPRQMWFGLEPGWVINVRDKVILKPKDETLKEYYKS